MAFLILGSAHSASAQQIPPGCNGSGISISIFAFFADGVTPAVGVDASSCETLIFRASLGYATQPPGNCAFQDGHLIITTPDGVEHDVTPAGGINVAGNPLSPATPGPITGTDVTYVVNPADVVAGQIVAMTSYNQSVNFTKGISFTGTPPSVGFNNGGTSIPVTVAPCTGTFCAPNVCDPNATSQQFPGRKGLCVAGTPPTCTVDPGLDPRCFQAECDPQLQMCVGDIPVVPTPPVCLPPKQCGNRGRITRNLNQSPTGFASTQAVPLDKLSIALRTLDKSVVDPSDKDVTVYMATDNGQIFTATVPAGGLKLKGHYYRYTNAAAATQGGISRLTIWRRPNGHTQIYVDAYGDLSGAKSAMDSAVTIGDRLYNHDGTWTPIPTGWKFP